MKQNKLLILAFFLVTAMNVFAQNKGYWQSTPTLQNRNAVIVKTNRNLIQPKLFQLDINSLKTALAGSPANRGGINSSNTIVSFPGEDGNLQNYSVFESSNMDPALAAKYPDIKSYVGKGIEDPTALIYFSVSPLGLQTMLLRADRPVVLIEPYTTDRLTYAVYKKGDRTSFSKFVCNTIDKGIDTKSLNDPTARPNADDGIKRTFRIALSATGEYTAYFGGTVALGLAAINNTLSRVNGIFETNFAVHFELVANNNLLIYTNAITDPYSDVITNQEIQENISAVIGDANYDIAEVFGTQNQGGNAGCIGCVCVNPADAEAPDKAKGSGFSTLPDPTGDVFDVDFVSHEFGHTLGGNHTFTYQPTLEGTGAQVEPGSGTTILSYAGYTGEFDILEHPYAYFHAVSIQQIMNNIKTKSCQVNSATLNNIPTANAGPNYTIPKGTPFKLTGTGTDANDAILVYNWEQMDEDVEDFTPYPNVNDATGPEFRNFALTTNNTRTFPELAAILDGTNSSKWEKLPNVARTLNFRFTVRDNHAGGSANNSDDAVVTISAAKGPFVVTAPNTVLSWAVGSSKTVTWNVAGTTGSPVSCANVKISLSTDGGNTFPIVLFASTPNDGSQTITVPNNVTTTARIKVEAVGNIFFDISNKNFSIIPAGACTPPTLSAAVTDVKCSGGNTGAINLTTTGGTSPFTYAWTGPGSFAATTQDLSALKAGSYKVTVTATGGCKTDKTFSVQEPEVLKISLSSKRNVSCKGGNDGLIIVKATGGTTPYSYRIHTQTTFKSSGTFGGRAANTYAVTVKDKNGCTATLYNIIITEPSTGNCNQAVYESKPNEAKSNTATLLKTEVLPNPSENEFTLRLSGSSADRVEVRVIDMYGRPVHKTRGSGNQSYKFGQHFIPGAYIIEVLQGSNRKTLKVIKK